MGKLILLPLLLVVTLFPPFIWTPYNTNRNKLDSINEFKNFSFLFDSEVKVFVVDSIKNTYEFSKKEQAINFIKNKIVLGSITQKERVPFGWTEWQRYEEAEKNKDSITIGLSGFKYYEVIIKEPVKIKFKRKILLSQLFLEYVILSIVFYLITLVKKRLKKLNSVNNASHQK